METEIVAVHLLDSVGLPVTELDSGDPLQIEIEYLAHRPVDAPIFGVTISREDEFICYDTNTAVAGVTLPTVQGQGKVVLQLERLDLIGEQYYVDVGVYEREWAYAYDYHWHVYPLLVRPTGGEKGVLRPPNHWEVGEVSVLHASLPTFKASRTGMNQQ
jgi:lipopolysaccharide transport system ATP-binding protein